MNNYSIRIEVSEGKIKELLDNITAATDVIRKSSYELEQLGFLKITETPSADTDGVPENN